MEVVITIRKEVPNRDEALDTFLDVKQALAKLSDLKITGHSNNHFEEEGDPS